MKSLEEARTEALNGTESGTVSDGSSRISNSISISSATMNVRPSERNRDIQVTGGLFGNMTQTELVIEKPTEKLADQLPSDCKLKHFF